MLGLANYINIIWDTAGIKDFIFNYPFTVWLFTLTFVLTTVFEMLSTVVEICSDSVGTKNNWFKLFFIHQSQSLEFGVVGLLFEILK